MGTFILTHMFEIMSVVRFGVLDAWRMVNAAKTWTPVPMLTTMAPPTIGADERIRADGVGLRVVATVTENDAQRHMLNSLENVQVTVTIEHGRRGDIEVTIVCPSGKRVFFKTQKQDFSCQAPNLWWRLTAQKTSQRSASKNGPSRRFVAGASPPLGHLRYLFMIVVSTTMGMLTK